MKKDFNTWNNKKTDLHEHKERPFFHEREVWWCSLGQNVGFEQDGKGEKFARPVVIFKKFNKEIFWAIPVSTKIKKGKFYCSIFMADNTERSAIISQIRLIDAKRLLDKMGVISQENYVEIQKAVMHLVVT